MKKLLIPVVVCALTLSLQGCFVAGAAAGAAGVAIVYDHRNVDSILQDQKISRRVYQKIQDDQELEDETHISVTSFGQVVLLTGEAPRAEQRQLAEEIARSIRGVKRVYNAITIQGKTSSLSHASDAWITTKIKTEMLATKGLKSASVKVVTENGTVYLMGTVTHAQQETLVHIATHTSGVQKVVKIFQYDEGLAKHEVTVEDGQPSASNASENSSVQEASSVKTQGTGEMDPLIPS